MSELTDDQLAAWERLAGEATPGPWTIAPTDDDRDWYDGPREAVVVSAAPAPGAVAAVCATCDDLLPTENNLADACFIAAARTGWPATIAEVRRMRQAQDAIAAELGDYVAQLAIHDAERDAALRERDKARAEAERLREAATALADRLDAITEHPSYKAVWSLAHAHGHDYTGPMWRDALDELRAALALTT